MSYAPTNWENGKTPINANNLNNMEKGIVDANNATITLNGTKVTNGTDVIAYFKTEAPEGISTLCVANPVNAYSTEQSWFTFYKIANYGRIEQRPINTNGIYVNGYSDGTLGGWFSNGDVAKAKDVSSLVNITSADSRYLGHTTKAIKHGAVRHLSITIRMNFGSNPLANAGNFDVNMTGFDFPKYTVTTNTFIGDNDFAVRLDSAGLIRVRNLSGKSVSPTELNFSFTYLV